MTIRQISVFVENKPGAMVSITQALGKAGVDLRALSLADTQDFGILRMIVDEPDKARNALKEIGVISKCTDVIAVYIDDKTGGLAEVLKVLSEEELGIEYMYAFLGRTHGKALMVLKADEPEKAIKTLEADGIKVATKEEI